MPLTVPTGEPTKIRTGTTVQWILQHPDFPSGDGWSVTYAFRGPSALNVQCSATQQNAHLATVAATPTGAALLPGDYWFQSFAASGSLRYLVTEGQMQVLPDLSAVSASLGGYDGRSPARKIVDTIDAFMAGRATLAQSSSSVDGRSLSNRPASDLLALRDKYARIVEQENAAQNVANGGSANRRIRVRFIRS